MLGDTRILLSAAFLFGSSMTLLADDVPDSKKTKLGLYLTAPQAAQMIATQDVLFVDIRSRAEVSFLGIPKQADVHIPYMVMPMMASFNPERQSYDMEMNPDFPGDFQEYTQVNGISKDSPIILMCRSGSRSARAANLLADLGYTKIYTIIDGYEGDRVQDGPHRGEHLVNGWRNAGLEWSYSIAASQLYPADR